ncbi:MAG: glycosyltransferase family 4 protein [Acidobacteria bacterium]|nr:glycosyltransferase family 4 protein [Acidobacteriota bacterium]
MRILQISSAVNFGGGERHLVDLCENLQTARGEENECEIFVAARARVVWLTRLSFLPKENIVRLPLKNSLDIFSARRLAKFIRAKNIEIVHAHLARDYPIAAFAARAAGAKLVLTRHLLFPLKRFHRFVLPNDATTFVAVSNAVRRSLLAQNLLPPERIRLIYNGVNISQFNKSEENPGEKIALRQRLDLPENSILVGVVGEIATHKGQTDFARAAPEILQRFPDARFLIVGRDNSAGEKHRAELENLIARLDLQNKIRLLGWADDVASIYRALDVFVSVSRIEPFGLVIVEAMAAGCAVVATETDGGSEIVENGKTGRLVPPENPRALAAAVIEMLSDENLRRDLGANARRAAIEKFSVGRMAAETQKLYKEILKNG